MADKDFKTVDEQLDILRSRGLIITDIDIARDFLLRNNYYRISGYSLTLRKNDIFYNSVSFQNIMDIYNFDYELRHIILQYVEIIEVQMKSLFSYEFTRLHGPLGYLNEEFFTDTLKYKQIIKKANMQAMKRLPNEAYLKHFIKETEHPLPLWAYVDLLTISDISILYSFSENKIKNAVALNFGLTTSHSSEILGNYMHSMTIIRNLCAHGSRIYNRLFEQKPSLNKKEKQLLILKGNGEIDNSHFYGFFIIMHRLLPHNIFKEMKSRIIQLTEKYPFVKMKYYGFRYDWQNKL